MPQLAVIRLGLRQTNSEVAGGYLWIFQLGVGSASVNMSYLKAFCNVLVSVLEDLQPSTRDAIQLSTVYLHFPWAATLGPCGSPERRTVLLYSLMLAQA